MSDQMASVPVVRHLILCDRAERLPGGRDVTLHRLIQTIRPRAGVEFPDADVDFSLFVAMADGRGRHTLWIELIYLDDESCPYRSPEATIELGQNPLQVTGWSARLNGIHVPQPGLYEVRQFCGGVVLASEPLLIKEIR